MKATLRGFQNLDFTTNDGQQMKGCNFFITFPDANIVGERAERIFVRSEVPIPSDLKIGEEINLAFNHKGKVEAVSKK